MAEQTFKSPGFFEREIEIINRPIIGRNLATPAAVIGTAQRGPAFVPTLISSPEEFVRVFGNYEKERPAGHAVGEFFGSSGKAVSFCRVLGSGVSSSGNLINAGFKLEEKTNNTNNTTKQYGAIHFLVANHTVNHAEHIGYGQLSDNDSITLDMDALTAGEAIGNLNTGEFSAQFVRAMIVPHKDYTVKVYDVASADTTADVDDIVTQNSGLFKIYFDDNSTHTKSYTVSLDPRSSNYISKVLNTNPFRLEELKHCLYAHFPVDDAVASAGGSNKVAVVTGEPSSSTQNKYGDFSSPFVSAKSPAFISQPFGNKEYDLFHFESLDDGEYANSKYKISITNLVASTDPKNEFGTFDVEIRDLKDTDESPVIYETYSRCSLNPEADNYIAKLIGDSRIRLELNVESDDEKRLIREGKFRNVSTRVRVVISDDVLKREVPDSAIPFGFRGIPALKTTSSNKDGSTTGTSKLKGRDAGNEIDGTQSSNKLGFAQLPPLPYRFKVTKGDIRDNQQKYQQTYLGQASDNEAISVPLYWGILTTEVDNINNVNSPTNKQFNELFVNYTKFLGKDSSVLIQNTASSNAADDFNNNKFSLSKVALYEGKAASAAAVDLKSISSTLTLNDLFKDAVYIRNADCTNTDIYDSATQTLNLSQTEDPFGTDSGGGSQYRGSLAKLFSDNPSKFNKFNDMAKFTAPLYGGFDGVNIFNRDDYYMTDRSASKDTGGHAISAGYSSALKLTDSGSTNQMSGTELNNNAIASFRNAVRLMTDGLVSNHNILVIPGIRDNLITDFAANRSSDYGKALYIMDIPYYSINGFTTTRLFADANGNISGRPDADRTSELFDGRQLNNSYVASYFPDVFILDRGEDPDATVTSTRSVRVPPSVVALGALAFTDSNSHPWFAPAGFSRGSLNTTTSSDVRLNAADRDTLYEARINPIANFPNNTFVIFGQKTTQLSKTALDRVNVRRLVLEVKRRIERIAQKLLFAQNNDC